MTSFKCEVCGTVTKATIRPHLCPKCGAKRARLHKVDENK